MVLIREGGIRLSFIKLGYICVGTVTRSGHCPSTWVTGFLCFVEIFRAFDILFLCTVLGRVIR